MTKISRNDPCPCGSGKQSKKCCQDKKPRENVTMIDSPERLRGVYYDHEKMEFMGITLDDRRIEFPWHGVSVFRNYPEELPAEKYGWLSVMRELSRYREDLSRRIALVTDHDLDNHQLYNERKIPIFKDFPMPPNFTLMYGRGDGSTENILNYLVKLCDRKSTELLKDIEDKGFFQYGNASLPIDQIPAPLF